jgi:hypothetical protein
MTIGRVIGGEGGHPDRLWSFHLLIDRIEISVHERSQRDSHPTMVAIPPLGGDERTRTADPLLAKQVLYQLSYVPADGILSTGS